MSDLAVNKDAPAHRKVAAHIKAIGRDESADSILVRSEAHRLVRELEDLNADAALKVSGAKVKQVEREEDTQMTLEQAANDQP